MRFSSYYYLFPSILLLALLSCKGQTPVEGQKEGDSHAKMVFILDSMANRAFYMDNFLMNDKHIEHWREKVALGGEERPDKYMQYRYKMGNEMLNAGQTGNAIQEFTDLIKMKPEKTLYDLLAISYMQAGERQSRKDNPSSASSIIPVTPEGWHRNTLGTESAAKMYLKILQSFPNDIQSRYLLNLAYMRLGQYPLGVPEAHRIPLEAFSPPNPGFPKFKEIAPSVNLAPTGHLGGVCMEDFNNDGHLDLFISSSGMRDPSRLFFANGDGTYKEATEAANLKGITGGINAMHADYNNDGWEDILILRGAWLDRGGRQANSLLRNNGDGTFSDVTINAGILSFYPTQAAAWGDLNNDGWLDLFIGNESKGEGEKRQSYPCELYVNNGDGTFTNISAQTSLNFEALVKGCAWGDINNDGLIDLYVSVLNGPNRLFLNLGGTTFYDWRFEEITAQAGVQEPLMSSLTWFFDYNNDGFQDIFVSGYDGKHLTEVGKEYASELLGLPLESETPRLFRNNGNSTFTDVAGEMGIKKVMYGLGGNFGDLDNDGWLDFYVGMNSPDFRALMPNRMFRNIDGQRFEEVTLNGFGYVQKGSGIAFGDMDNDGDQEIYCVTGGFYQGDVSEGLLFENPGFQRSWLTLTLEGKTSNRSAIGARLRIIFKEQGGRERVIYRTIGTGGSFGSASLQEEIGLGNAVGNVSLEVSWPGGTKQEFKSLPINGHIRIKEGEGK
ncbi:MAG: CRTAC1 family protein [Saprospirales bacterium]|nr:CRTAC1 family protein [Saprospirales bacterium]